MQKCLIIFSIFCHRSNSSASSEHEDRTSYKVSSDTEDERDEMEKKSADKKTADINEEAAAAVVLQSHMKGMMVRKQLKEKKAETAMLKKQLRYFSQIIIKPRAGMSRNIITFLGFKTAASFASKVNV